MDPLKQHLAYTSTRCGVAVNVMSAYAGKGVVTAPPPVDGRMFSSSNADSNGGDGSRRGGEGGRAQSPATEHHRDANSRASPVSPPPASAAAVAAAAAAAEAAAKSQAVSAAAASRHYQQTRQVQESSGASIAAGRRHAVSSADFEGREGCERGVSGGGGGGVGMRIAARSAAVGAWERTSGSPSRAGSDVGATSADGVGLDGFLFIPSSAPVASSVPAPAQTLSSSPVGLVYVGELTRNNENLFDLGGGPHAFDPGRNEMRRTHSVPASDFDFGGDMGRGNGGSRGPRVSTKSASHRGGADGEDHSDSGGSSPLNCGLSSDTPLAPGDGHRERGDSCDGGESAMISGMFASV